MNEKMEWLREGHTIYTLMHHSWAKGVEQFKNRFYFNVYADKSCTPEEVDAVVAQLHAAANALPDVVAALEAIIQSDQTALPIELAERAEDALAALRGAK